jgi:hypothetical protein
LKTTATNESPEAPPLLVKLVLYPGQARPFSRLLEDLGGISGILCTDNQALDLNDGRLLLELQAARLDRKATLKIQELIRFSQQRASTCDAS